MEFGIVAKDILIGETMEHRQLTQEVQLTYKFVAEFDSVREARQYETQLIKKYKRRGLCRFNKRLF